MKKLLLLLVPLVLLVSCETSAEVVEVAVEPPQSDVIVGKLIVCGDGTGVYCFSAAMEETDYSSAQDAGYDWDTVWQLTVRTSHGTTYTITTDFFKDLEGWRSDPERDWYWLQPDTKQPEQIPEPKLGDPWPPSE